VIFAEIRIYHRFPGHERSQIRISAKIRPSAD